MEKQLRKYMRDYLNKIIKEESTIKFPSFDDFDIKKCEICGGYNLEEDLIDTETTKGIGIICESCLEDSKE